MTDTQDDVVFVGYIDHDQVTLDTENANIGTERGMWQLEESLDQFGAGRAVLLSAENAAIAGNKTLEKWIERGGKVAVVETDGKTLIAVRRRDLSLLGEDDGRARGLAFADNRVGQLNLRWDIPKLAAGFERPELSLDRFWTEEERADLAHLAQAPSLDALEGQYGSFDETRADWRAIRLSVPQETYDRFTTLMRGFDGDEHERFAALLDRASASS